MASVFVAFERDLLIERIHAGLTRARKEGKHLGRPRKCVSPKMERKIRRLGAFSRVQPYPIIGDWLLLNTYGLRVVPVMIPCCWVLIVSTAV
jgi:hypothetical protein